VPKRRPPVVRTQEEVGSVLTPLEGAHLLLARLLYGTGMRITETLRWRVKDLDFGQHTVSVGAGKGGKGSAWPTAVAPTSHGVAPASPALPGPNQPRVCGMTRRVPLPAPPRPAIKPA
jgi:integrase